MKNLIVPLLLVGLLSTSCVSKKKFAALESQYKNTRGNLQKTTLEKEALEAKFAKIDRRVAIYNKKINSLESENVTLEKENAIKFDVKGNAVMSKNARKLMNETLSKVDANKLANAKTLNDSINLALSYNIVLKTLGITELKNSEDINIEIDQTVVMISISDKLLFNTASFKIKKGAYELITKLADIIESEPSLDVMIEGHTDSRTINTAVLQDNWDLSVKRATSIVRLLQDKFNIDGSRLIASGRGDTVPLLPNTSNANRAKNRRTRIVILPNLNKFFALLANEDRLKN